MLLLHDSGFHSPPPLTGRGQELSHHLPCPCHEVLLRADVPGLCLVAVQGQGVFSEDVLFSRQDK